MDSFVDEERETASSYENLLAQSLNESRLLLIKTSQLGTAWLQDIFGGEMARETNERSLSGVRFTFS